MLKLFFIIIHAQSMGYLICAFSPPRTAHDAFRHCSTRAPPSIPKDNNNDSTGAHPNTLFLIRLPIVK